MRRKKINPASPAETAASTDGTGPALAAPVEELEPAAAQNGPADELRQPVPGKLPLLPLRDNVLFPAVVAPLTISSESSVQLIDDAAVSNTRVIGVVTMRDA